MEEDVTEMTIAFFQQNLANARAELEKDDGTDSVKTESLILSIASLEEAINSDNVF